MLCADFDRDGGLDLDMTSHGSSTQNSGTPKQNRLYRNEGLSFTNVASSAGVAFTSPSSSVGDSGAWGDEDLDGDLDLATQGWSAHGLANRLLRNDGGSFLDVSSTSISIPASWESQPTFIDLTDDGLPELLLAADFQTSRAWRNNRDGSFALSTAQLRLGLDDNRIGACIADFKGTATPDCFVTSVYSARPNPGAWPTETEYIFHSNGGVNFTRLGRETGMSLAADARCVLTRDYDHTAILFCSSSSTAVRSRSVATRRIRNCGGSRPHSSVMRARVARLRELEQLLR